MTNEDLIEILICYDLDLEVGIKSSMHSYGSMQQGAMYDEYRPVIGLTNGNDIVTEISI